MFIKSSFSSVLMLTALLATTNGFAMDVKNEDLPGHSCLSKPKEKECDEQSASALIVSSDARNLELMNLIPVDIWKKFIKVWSENGIDPRIVQGVCKIWCQSTKDKTSQKSLATPPKTNKNFDFMTSCMCSYLKTKASKGKLLLDSCCRTMSIKTNLRLTIDPICLFEGGVKSSDFMEGTFEFQNQVITFREDLFNAKGRWGNTKLLTFICPLYLAKDLYPYGNWTSKSNEPTTRFALIWKKSGDAFACHEINLATDFKADSPLRLYDYYVKAVSGIKEYKEYGENLMWVRLVF